MITSKFHIHFSFWSGVAAAAGTVASTLFGNKANANLNRKNRVWQDQQRIASQEYQTSERLDQNQFAEDMYNKYESPQAQVDQLKAAGLNPRLAADGSGSVAASSGSSGGAPSPVPNNVPYMNVPDLGTGFGNIAKALEGLANAKKSGVETQNLENLLDENLRSAKLQNIAQDFLNSFNQKYMSPKAEAEIRSLLVGIDNGILSGYETSQRIKKIGQQFHLDQKIIDSFDERLQVELSEIRSRTELNKATKLFTEAQTDLTREEIKEVAPRIQSLVASAAQSYASARNLDVNSDQSEEFRDVIMRSMIQDLKGKTAEQINKELDNRAKELENWNLSVYGRKEIGTDMFSNASSTIADQSVGRRFEAKHTRVDDNYFQNLFDDYDSKRKSRKK
ncbi:DNA pilot protein [Sigmofec virus UA08Rod_4124]|uniref:DNA pilot protein n=1 Tax=Sigmofec virus UA08Rod_4124 TaxID=2929395 RepID=A0A976R5D6_9VIRU|nr:DNA pilot protein [Sigmofec virus UA08Rod_4124]